MGPLGRTSPQDRGAAHHAESELRGRGFAIEFAGGGARLRSEGRLTCATIRNGAPAARAPDDATSIGWRARPLPVARSLMRDGGRQRAGERRDAASIGRSRSTRRSRAADHLAPNPGHVVGVNGRVPTRRTTGTGRRPPPRDRLNGLPRDGARRVRSTACSRLGDETPAARPSRRAAVVRPRVAPADAMVVRAHPVNRAEPRLDQCSGRPGSSGRNRAAPCSLAATATAPRAGRALALDHHRNFRDRQARACAPIWPARDAPPRRDRGRTSTCAGRSGLT